MSGGGDDVFGTEEGVGGVGRREREEISKGGVYVCSFIYGC